MDRLTKVTGNDKVKLINFSDEVEEKYPDFSERLELMFEKLAYYEDLEEQGRLVKLPCKVGDTVYKVDRVSEKIKQHKVIGFGDEQVAFDNYKYCFLSLFGKTVFLTKEEAEAELKSYLKKYNKENIERD